jgi:hypothetical protein
VPTVRTIQDAEANFRVVDFRLRAEVSSTPEMQSAVQALNQGYRALRTADDEITRHLSTDPLYRSASVRRAEAQQKLDNLRAQNAAIDDLALAAAEVMNCGSIMTRLHAEAQRADASYQQAKASIADASARIWVIREEWEHSMSLDPRWVAARQSLDQARALVRTTMASR